VAEDENGHVVGFAGCGPVRDSEKEYVGELYGIYVNQSVQGKGVGRMLCREVARNLKSQALDSMLVWVLADNPSKGFYERLGGRRVREKEITIGGKVLTEWGYGWKNLDSLVV
jgi:ribosomal protein S18 acetylase RimI-like enzyme